MLSPSASSDVVLEVMLENKPIYKIGQIVFSETSSSSSKRKSVQVGSPCKVKRIGHFLFLFSGTVFSIFAETASSPNRWEISTLIVWSFYSSEVSLCGREAGEKEKRKHERDDGRGRRESLFPFPSFPLAF